VRPPTEAAPILTIHRFNDGQIDVLGRNPKRQDGPSHYHVLASGDPAHSQTRRGIQRRIRGRGMTARERTLKRRLRIRLHRRGHQRLKPPRSASRPVPVISRESPIDLSTSEPAKDPAATGARAVDHHNEKTIAGFTRVVEQTGILERQSRADEALIRLKAHATWGMKRPPGRSVSFPRFRRVAGCRQAADFRWGP